MIFYWSLFTAREGESIQLEHCEEGLLRYLHVANLLHAFLTLLLLLQQFALTAHVTAVALGRHVLAHLLHRLTGNDLGANGGLDGNVKLLARDELLQLLTHAAAKGLGIVEVGQRREGIHRVTVE